MTIVSKMCQVFFSSIVQYFYSHIRNEHLQTKSQSVKSDAVVSYVTFLIKDMLSTQLKLFVNNELITVECSYGFS